MAVHFAHCKYCCQTLQKEVASYSPSDRMAQEDEISSADSAYHAALEAIERARAAEEPALDFDQEPFQALDRIPPQITGIKGLKHLDLNYTQVSDLTPLRSLTGLQGLFLSQTKVRDLAPDPGLAAAR